MADKTVDTKVIFDKLAAEMFFGWNFRVEMETIKHTPEGLDFLNKLEEFVDKCKSERESRK